MKVRVTEAAWADMLHIGRSIRQGAPRRAETFVQELFDCCESLAYVPRAYPLLPGHEEAGIRRRLYGNYLIFYRLDDNEVQILHVLHGARDYDRILFPDE